jgi:hypothetical protein
MEEKQQKEMMKQILNTLDEIEFYNSKNPINFIDTEELKFKNLRLFQWQINELSASYFSIKKLLESFQDQNSEDSIENPSPSLQSFQVNLYRDLIKNQQSQWNHLKSTLKAKTLLHPKSSIFKGLSRLTESGNLKKEKKSNTGIEKALNQKLFIFTKDHFEKQGYFEELLTEFDKLNIFLKKTMRVLEQNEIKEAENNQNCETYKKKHINGMKTKGTQATFSPSSNFKNVKILPEDIRNSIPFPSIKSRNPKRPQKESFELPVPKMLLKRPKIANNNVMWGPMDSFEYRKNR